MQQGIRLGARIIEAEIVITRECEVVEEFEGHEIKTTTTRLTAITPINKQLHHRIYELVEDKETIKRILPQTRPRVRGD